MGASNDVLVVIPARLASTRLTRKVLAMVGGKPLMQYAWGNACEAVGVDNVLIASNDDEVLDAAAGFGASVQWTGAARNGTLRVNDAVITSGREPNVIVNLQADEPDIPSDLILAVCDYVTCLADGEVATVAFPAHGHDGDPQQTKVVIGKNNRCLFFSRRPLPCCMYHAGIYGYTPETLRDIRLTDNLNGESPISRAENLEQLDWIYDERPVRAVRWAKPMRSINTAADLVEFEASLT